MKYKISNMSGVKTLDDMIQAIGDMEEQHVLFVVELHDYQLKREPGNNIIHQDITTAKFVGKEPVIGFLFDKFNFGWELANWNMKCDTYRYTEWNIVLYRSDI